MSDEGNENDPINEITDEIQNKTGMQLELGDIIQIIAPTNEGLNEETFLITYIDESKIKIINITTHQIQQLNVDEHSYFADESIRTVFLLSRSDVAGYARQNKLLPRTWVEIHFGGEFPVIITGEITNLDEDMIEVTTYPELEVIYIDFQYKGILDDLPIDKILIREKPTSLGKYDSLTDVKEIMEDGEIPEHEDTDATMEYTETGESIIHIPESASPNDNIRDVLQAVYLDANDIFGEDLGDIIQLVEIPEGQKRYGIDLQVNDLMDELLSTVPNSKRTSAVLGNIHNLVERFKELRDKFSKFDENGNVTDMKMVGDFYKPLVHHISKLNTNLKWIVPVVSQRKTILFNSKRDIEEREDIMPSTNGDDLKLQQGIQEDYFNNRMQGDELKYERMYTRLQSAASPFHPPILDDNCLISNQEVLANIDSIVNNFGEFQSTIFKADTIARRKYVIQRYNLGLTKIDSKQMKSGKKIYNRQNLTPNDKMTMTSLIALPESIMSYSRIDLPGTNIMVKSQLSQRILQLSRVFKSKNKQKIPSYTVDNFDNEIKYEEISDDKAADKEKEKDKDKYNDNDNDTDEIKFLSGIKEYTLDESLDGEDDKLNKFLNVIFPKTRALIKFATKYNTDQLTVVDVIRSLEPFMVYSDDITWGQYMEIRYFIKNQIFEHAKQLENRAKAFDILRSTRYMAVPFINRIKNMFLEKPDLFEWFTESYKLSNVTMGQMGNSSSSKELTLSSSEILYKINNIDGGILYLNLITYMLLSLITPNKLLFNKNMAPDIDDLTSTEKIRASDCARRFITKRYSSIRSLQADNNVEQIFYDDEFDDTPYSILKKYSDKHKKMLSEDFVEFLTETLIQKHDCPPALAKDLATTLIAGKKTVKDSEYAILEIRPQLPETVDKSKLSEKEKKEIESEANIRIKTQYYRRLKDNWVLDKEVDEESFIDTNTLFCNLRNKCNKNQNLNTCESLEETGDRMTRISNSRVINEFDKRYSITVEELEKELNESINQSRQNIRKRRCMQNLQLYRANDFAYELGKYAIDDEIIESPYIKLRDMILGQSDFVKKQHDICRLMEKYCREPMITELKEDANWAYCKETNTKLLPISIFQLANAYTSGGDYQLKLDELCRTIGVSSDDGDSTVDRHSGYILRKKEFVNEDGFDDMGFKMTTHDIMEKDLGTVVAQALQSTEETKEKKVFEDEITEIVYNVFSQICKNIGIVGDSIEEFVLRVSVELINNKDIVLGEKAYIKRAEKADQTKGAISIPYLIYRNQTIITIVGCILLIAIQTAVPSFTSKNTFPGCVKSFSGYPMSGGVEDTSGLTYIACVIDKTKSGAIKPWDSISKLNAASLAKRMKSVLQSYILTRSDIRELFLVKKEYLLLHPDEIVPEELSIKRWWQFLPPVVPFTITKTLHGVSADYEKEMLTLMQKGNKDQREHLGMFKSKIVQHTYGIVESINAIVKTKELLMKTSSNEPFLENACCNESDKSTNPISYFTEADPNIDVFIRKSEKMAKIIGDVEELSKAAILYSPEFTGTVYPTLPTEHSEVNIYAAFVHYCNFDRDVPVSDEIKLVCSEKPDNYNRVWSIEEKIEFLKKYGKQYNIDNLNHLMAIINRRNLVIIPSVHVNAPIAILTDILERMDMNDSVIVEEPLRRLLGNAIDAYDPKVMKNEYDGPMNKLIQYLSDSNKRMLSEIMAFLKEYGKLSKTDYDNIESFITNIHVWNLDNDKNDGLSTVTQFIKNSVFAMIKNYPNVILNSTNYNTIPAIMGDMSNIHKRDVSNFVKSYTAELSKFKGDKKLEDFLQVVHGRLIDLNTLTEHLTVQTSIKKDGETFYSLFDKPTTYMLFTYCWYTVIHEYITVSKNDTLLLADVQLLKQTRREHIRENQNVSDSMGSVDIDESDPGAIDVNDDLETIKLKEEIRRGELIDLKTNVCSLLLAFIRMEQKNKKSLDYSYEQITKRVIQSREEEKKKITDFLEKMEKDERAVEKMLKKYKIGRWNAGMQKGLFQYDKDTYDRERDANVARLFDDLEYGQEDGEAGVTAEELDREAADEADADAEQQGIDDLDENYNDGTYYEEDRDEDRED